MDSPETEPPPPFPVCRRPEDDGADAGAEAGTEAAVDVAVEVGTEADPEAEVGAGAGAEAEAEAEEQLTGGVDVVPEPELVGDWLCSPPLAFWPLLLGFRSRDPR